MQHILPVIPGTKGNSCNHHFRKADSFPLSPRDTSNEIIANLGVVSVTYAKDGHGYLGEIFAVLVSAHAFDSV